MSQQIYWHAPLWQVVIMAAIGLMLFVGVALRTLRTPQITDLWTRLLPELDGQPLLSFNRAKGLQPLNQLGQQLVATLLETTDREWRDRFYDVLFEALTEDRQIIGKDWPAEGQTLSVLPFFNNALQETALLVTILLESPAFVADKTTINDVLPIDAIRGGTSAVVQDAKPIPNTEWVALGQSLLLHPSQPFVKVQRDSDVLSSESRWQEETLSFLEERLLRYLASHVNQVQKAESLFAAIWTEDEVDRIGLRPDQRDRLRRLVFQVRKQIERDPRNPRYLQTAHGMGYTFYGEG